LFQVYRCPHIRRFLREHGECWLSPVTFSYWRKLLGVRKWTPTPFEKAMGWPP
jgi:hypothetical protein